MRLVPGAILILTISNKDIMHKTILLLLAIVAIAGANQVAAQDMTTITTSGGDQYKIEFLGTSDAGYTWTYRVSEIAGKDLSHWTLGLCIDTDEIVDWTPKEGDNNGQIGEVDFGLDPTTGVSGIKWNTGEDYDGDGDENNDVYEFSFTLSKLYPIQPTPVAAKTQTVGHATINGPGCDIDVCELAEPPAWDGEFFNVGNGSAQFTVTSETGIKEIYLTDADNAVISAVGIDQFELVDGVWTLMQGVTAPLSVTVTLEAPEQRSSFFFAHLVDLCDRTVVVDPQLNMHEGGEVVEAAVLGQNYPNPFNPTTSIGFELSQSADVVLSVYNVTGQLVKTLATGTLQAGAHTVSWDGRNELGAVVPSGVYLYRLEAGDFTHTKQLLLLK